MNQKIMIVDNFYDFAYHYHKSFDKDQCLVSEETISKISHLIQKKVKVAEAFNETSLSPKITANTVYDWIAVIYLSLPSECTDTQGMNFYIHKKTELDSFPNDYAMSLHGLQSIEDIRETFNIGNIEDWERYVNIFVRYNRLVLFRADLWHSYGSSCNQELNKSISYQKILLQDG